MLPIPRRNVAETPTASVLLSVHATSHVGSAAEAVRVAGTQQTTTVGVIM